MSMQQVLNDLRTNLNRELTDKDTAHNYIPVYQTEMDKTKDVSILEIGVWRGGSLLLWDTYFENATIFGVDLYPKFNGIVPEGIDYPVYVIDSQDKESCDANFSDETFDYIVDDGLHKVEAQIKTFDNYFSKLKPGGKYFIEDVELFENVDIIKKHLSNYNYKFYDLRSIGNRPDDMMFVITKD
jgi:hypothetical protein